MLVLAACSAPKAASVPESESPAATGTASAKPPPQLAVSVIIGRASATPGSATAESYTNVHVEQSEGRWAFNGCVASLPGSCRRTLRTFLSDEQVAELSQLIEDLANQPDSAMGDGCCGAVDRLASYEPDDYRLSYGDVACSGSLRHPKRRCAQSVLVEWVANNCEL